MKAFLKQNILLSILKLNDNVYGNSIRQLLAEIVKRDVTIGYLTEGCADLREAELNAAKQVFIAFKNLNMLMGWMGVIIRAIAMASHIEPETLNQVFGPAFAVCVLTLFYALFIKALCYAAEAKIQFKIINLKP